MIEVVDELDLSGFRAAYRSDGHGRAAYDPAMVVAVLLYAYSLGVRSSREIERRCVEDIAFRVLTGGDTPDHTTFARSAGATRTRWPPTLRGADSSQIHLSLGHIGDDGFSAERAQIQKCNPRPLLLQGPASWPGATSWPSVDGRSLAPWTARTERACCAPGPQGTMSEASGGPSGALRDVECGGARTGTGRRSWRRVVPFEEGHGDPLAPPDSARASARGA